MTEDDWIAVRENAYSMARALGFALIGAIAGAIGLVAVIVWASWTPTCLTSMKQLLHAWLMFMLGVFG